MLIVKLLFKKYDNSKRGESWECIEPVADILTFGAEKYGERSWMNVPNAPERYKAALFRHLIAWCKGEKIDAESGRSHLHHALVNIVFMIHFELEEKKHGQN